MNERSGARHRVLLVREWDQQMSGSGCCGRLNTATVQSLSGDVATPYAHTRADMERVGGVYRALRDRFAEPDVELTVVDPRNTVWLLPAIWRDARRRGLSRRSSLRQMVRANAPCTVVCDGMVLARDATPEQAVAAVEADISGQASGQA
jgi:hypothetical protein